MAAYSETMISNLALGKIGAKRINSFDSDISVEAIACRAHYAQARDALLRSHVWKFASGRAVLSADAATPSFGFKYQYILPVDFLRLKHVVGRHTHMLEGKRILTNHDTCKIEYIRRVTDCSEFDPGFVSALTLALAVELTLPLAGGGAAGLSLRNQLAAQLKDVLPKVRLVDVSEDEEEDHRLTWLQARRVNLGGR